MGEKVTRKYKLTPEQLKEIQRMGQIGLPVRSIAVVVGIPHATFERMIAEKGEAHEALEKGRVAAQGKIYQTLFSKIVDDRCTTSMIFWMKTREHFQEVNRLEVSGPDGKPMKIVSELSDAQIDAETKRLESLEARFGKK